VLFAGTGGGCERGGLNGFLWTISKAGKPVTVSTLSHIHEAVHAILCIVRIDFGTHGPKDLQLGHESLVGTNGNKSNTKGGTKKVGGLS
jgi:hypothetical protein